MHALHPGGRRAASAAGSARHGPIGLRPAGRLGATNGRIAWSVTSSQSLLRCEPETGAPAWDRGPGQPSLPQPPPPDDDLTATAPARPARYGSQRSGPTGVASRGGKTELMARAGRLPGVSSVSKREMSVPLGRMTVSSRCGGVREARAQAAGAAPVPGDESPSRGAGPARPEGRCSSARRHAPAGASVVAQAQG